MVMARSETIQTPVSFDILTNRGRPPSAAAPTLGSLFVKSSKEMLFGWSQILPVTICLAFL